MSIREVLESDSLHVIPFFLVNNVNLTTMEGAHHNFDNYFPLKKAPPSNGQSNGAHTKRRGGETKSGTKRVINTAVPRAAKAQHNGKRLEVDAIDRTNQQVRALLDSDFDPRAVMRAERDAVQRSPATGDVSGDAPATRNYPLALERRKKRDLSRDAAAQMEELELLTRRLIQIQEQQQQTISRELHDNVAQVLSAVTNRLTLARTSAAKLPAWLMQELHDLQESLNTALTDIRTLARELRPSLLDHCGFTAALEKHANGFRDRTGIDFEFDVDGQAAIFFDNEHLTHLFRLVQEALQNIEEHSGAARAWLRLGRSDGQVHLEIGDDGCAFSEERLVEAQRDGHLGLLGMRERAELLGGRFYLEAIPSQGTTIRVTVPPKKNSNVKPIHENHLSPHC